MQNHEVYNSSITSDLPKKMRGNNEIYSIMDKKLQTNVRSFFSHSFTHWDLLLNLIFILHCGGTLNELRVLWGLSSYYVG